MSLKDAAANREYHRQWYAENREYCAAEIRAKKERDPERYQAIAKRAQEKWLANPENREKKRQAFREWRSKNRETMRLHEQSRRAAIADAMGRGVTPSDWRELVDSYMGMCVYCYRRDVPMTMDHITPLERGGEHDVDNIAPACGSCNSEKHTKSLIRFLRDRVARSRYSCGSAA